jgi:Peptidase family M28
MPLLEPVGAPGMRRIFLASVVLVAILLLSWVGLQPPAPLPAAAPPDTFSAARAMQFLGRILTDEQPHPIGSAANDTVRSRIVTELSNLGYQPKVQTAQACSELGVCATVNNVVARLDGALGASGPQDAVLLASHYDSVPAGPGYSDDGTSVAATLEIARALKAAPAPRHPVIVLIDDGEEAGLLGAHAFVDSHPWASQVRAAVNLDARGTSGPSLMFETGSASEWAVRLYAQRSRRPAFSSIFYTVYKLLPNDTDFTVFRAAGYQGLNFAYIGGVARYHTPLDNSANVTPASLQHQGQNGLAAVTALANADLSAPPQRDAIFFDIFGRRTIQWPVRRSLPFALAVMLLLIFEIVWMIHRKSMTVAEFLSGFFGWLSAITATSLLAVLFLYLLHLAGATQVPWVAHPLPLEVCFGALGVAVVVIHGVLLARKAGFWGLWCGAWTWWVLLSVLAAWLAPGLSYLWLLPAGAAALAGLSAFVGACGEARGSLAAILPPLIVAAVIGFPLPLLFYSGLGNKSLVPIAIVVAGVCTAAFPLAIDLRNDSGLRGIAFAAAPVVAVALAAFLAIVAPAYSAKSPERLNIEYWEDADVSQSAWIVEPDSGRLPEPVRLAAAFRRLERGAFPWDTRSAFASDAPNLDLQPPTFTILESMPVGDRHVYRTLLRSERGAPYAAVLFPPNSDLSSARIEDQPLAADGSRSRTFPNGWSAYACPAMPAGGIEISFSLPAGKPIEVYVADESYGLPEEGKFLVKSRPLTATPSQDGDVTVVTRRVQLIP